MNFDYDSFSNRSDDLKTELTRERSVSRLSLLENMLRAFSSAERLVLYGLTILLGASVFALLAGLNAAVSVEVPAHGGAIVEGEVGPARFINPVLTLSQPDEDLAELVYSGLTRVLPDGLVVPDLAESYEISKDGMTYTFRLRPSIVFHDNTPVTSADVVFTVQAAQNPDIKSPRRADWEGVNISAPDPRTVVFKLPHAYAPFIENTTLGILPKHIWQSTPPEEFPFSPANTRPVGSGPYKVSSTEVDQTGSATRYELSPFEKFALGKPYIESFTFVFYPNQEEMLQAFDAHKIDALAGVAPRDLLGLKRGDFNVVRVALPRVFGVFLNQSHAPALADTFVRAALDAAVDKRAIVARVLSGYGTVLEGPIPPGVFSAGAPATALPLLPPATSTLSAQTSRADSARAILARGGWKFDEAAGVWKKAKLTLSLTLATADGPELLATAQAVAEYWRAAGISVEVEVYPLSELNTSVIRPRAYDAVLFGEVVGRTADLFAFWHSSQRNDPGLNLALYANSRADAFLSQARATIDEKPREKLYEQFAAVVAKDQPAIFLYAPEFIYVVPQALRGVALGALSVPSERYLNVYEWYTDTEQVWSVFTDRSN